MENKKLPNSDKLYIGIDQSIVCTSVALLKDGEFNLHRIKSDLRGPPLLELLALTIAKIYHDASDIAGVAIEGYAYGAKGAYFNLGEVGGVIRLETQKAKLPLVQVPPTTLKKFLTGKGTSPKDVMIKELYKKYEIDTNDNNDADAMALALLAYEYYETEYHIVEAYRTELHKTCKLVIGEHPKPMSRKDYFKDMPDDMNLAQYEKIRKKKT